MKKLTVLSSLLMLCKIAFAQAPANPQEGTMTAYLSEHTRNVHRHEKDSTPDAGLAVAGKAPGPIVKLVDRLFPSAFSSALTQGTGIAAFIYVGTDTATVAIGNPH
jgi:hypothetical protein